MSCNVIGDGEKNERVKGDGEVGIGWLGGKIRIVCGCLLRHFYRTRKPCGKIIEEERGAGWDFHNFSLIHHRGPQELQAQASLIAVLDYLQCLHHFLRVVVSWHDCRQAANMNREPN